MRKFLYRGIAIFFGLQAIGACTTDSGLSIKCTINGETKDFVTSPGKEDCDKIRASGANSTTPLAVAPTTPSPTQTPIFTNPVVSKPTPGFTEPTNKTQRQNQIGSQLSGRQKDPFAVISGSVPQAVTIGSKRLFIPTAPVNVTPNTPVTPDTSEAEAILVTGIMEIGNNGYAIVTAPGEPTSRAVSVGQTLSRNVLVKRIESIAGKNFLVLEQNNVEVRRPIYEKNAKDLLEGDLTEREKALARRTTAKNLEAQRKQRQLALELGEESFGPAAQALERIESEIKEKQGNQAKETAREDRITAIRQSLTQLKIENQNNILDREAQVKRQEAIKTKSEELKKRIEDLERKESELSTKVP
jgi:hypothetical protein